MKVNVIKKIQKLYRIQDAFIKYNILDVNAFQNDSLFSYILENYQIENQNTDHHDELILTDDMLESLGLVKKEDIERSDIGAKRDLKIQLISQAKEILYSNVQMHWEINKEYKKLPDAKEIVKCADVLFKFVTSDDVQ